jgi:hypothetical protein
MVGSPVAQILSEVKIWGRMAASAHMVQSMLQWSTGSMMLYA